MEINGDVTDAGRTNDERTREDRATQPMDAGWLSFAKMQVMMVTHNLKENVKLEVKVKVKISIELKVKVNRDDKRNLAL